MTASTLGRLERVELRDIWTTEAADFTPWLAQPENLAILGEALAIDLELEAQEKAVGPFRPRAAARPDRRALRQKAAMRRRRSMG